ncbi:MAG: CaiB/BaiF CoA-transferase family protein [Pseudomonadota bacterium]|nr:CaiB/BaiF CoA-transferase family protein [Pseudomonadota bacterium]
MAGPLSGLRVLDLSRVLAGPWCSQILADMGSEVIKIERPKTGDDTRHWGPPWIQDNAGKVDRQSTYYMAANRGKNSVTLDIGSEEGRELIKQLVAESDILIENFKQGTMERKGLGYDTLSEINPGLIYCSITGFGQTGPMASYAGYDYLIQAQSGLMSITGVPDGEPGAGPTRVGVAVSDLTTGMNSTIAILAALHHRNGTGEGQYIDMALLDVQVSWLANQGLSYLATGKVPGRTGGYHPTVVPYQPFPTKDGQLIIAIGNEGQFQRLCKVMGLPELLDDARFASNEGRVENREALIERLSLVTRTCTSREWMDRLIPESVPCGPIQNIGEVFEDPQVIARGMKLELEHSALGKVPSIANPIKYSRTPIEYKKAPPVLGEDTDAVLSKVLHKSPEEIDSLRKKQVI